MVRYRSFCHALYFARSLIPDSWTEKHADDPEFQQEVVGWGNRKYIMAKHPLEKQLHISRLKKNRVAMGLLNDKSVLENIKIADGLLTICDIIEVEG